jgi:hypothetical protein
MVFLLLSTADLIEVVKHKAFRMWAVIEILKFYKLILNSNSCSCWCRKNFSRSFKGSVPNSIGAAFIAGLQDNDVSWQRGCTNLPGGPTFRDDEYVNTAAFEA